jgi:hypothetical protein
MAQTSQTVVEDHFRNKDGKRTHFSIGGASQAPVSSAVELGLKKVHAEIYLPAFFAASSMRLASFSWSTYLYIS